MRRVDFVWGSRMYGGSRLAAAALLLSLLLLAGLVPGHVGRPRAAAGRVLHVAPGGSDAAPGTVAAPWGTMQYALTHVQPGDTLVVHGGTYRERVKVFTERMVPGTADAPITVLAAAGERPVIEGLLWLYGASYWTVDGIDVTWGSANARNEHMVVFHGGKGWRLTNSEIWGARSYAGLLIGRGASGFRVDHNYIHHTYAANNVNQDHLIYVDNGHSGSGVIERNVLAHSPNGRGVKLGPGSLDLPGTNNIVIRYNTFFSNQGPANVQFSGSSSNNTVERNVMVRPRAGHANVTRWNLTGTNNRVAHNAVWESTAAADWGGGIVDGGGNVGVDPRFAGPDRGDYTPTNPEALTYGHRAPGDTVVPTEPLPPVPARSTSLACPEGVVPEDGFADLPAGVAHEPLVDCVVWWRLAAGQTDDHYGASGPVTRSQMASFVGRLLESAGVALPGNPDDHFGDDDGSVHELRINQVAALGVVGGVGPGVFEPGSRVSREQMATFLVNALEHVVAGSLDDAGDTTWFVDVGGSVHEPAITKAAAAGIATGIAPGFFDPRSAVRRDQMASFLARTLDLVVDGGFAAPPTA